MEPLYNGHLWGPTFHPLQRGVPNSGASGIFPVGMVLRNPAVEYNVAAFSELSFAARCMLFCLQLTRSCSQACLLPSTSEYFNKTTPHENDLNDVYYCDGYIAWLGLTWLTAVAMPPCNCICSSFPSGGCCWRVCLMLLILSCIPRMATSSGLSSI